MLLQQLCSSLCPYCGEMIELLVDSSVPQQDYIEDCQVCCQPMRVLVSIDENDVPSVETFHEND